VRLQGISYDAAEEARWRSWLSDAERRCLADFGAESRRRDFLTGRAAARVLLSAVLSTEPGAVPLRRADDDAVDVEQDDWHVSIAHSDAHALAVCARHPVGVDLERIQPRNPGIADFLFRADDRGLLDELPYTDSASLILCWALKEAVLKARRSGFRTSPKALRLSVHPDEETARVRVEDGTEWHLVYARLSSYWAAVAIPAP
jgi:4'-phosphopantetheinyl transferase